MSKTPEEMAEEYAELMSFDVRGHQRGFLAGYKAAQDQLADTSMVMNSLNNLNGWISVKERLPDNALEVIAISNGKSTAFLHKLAYCRWIIDETITHWMPLPELPKEEK